MKLKNPDTCRIGAIALGLFLAGSVWSKADDKDGDKSRRIADQIEETAQRQSAQRGRRGH